ncbi:MAG TPA: diaminopimelate epimerase [Candidatus Competibacteraceae bacterium]|nr:diaminopimelate epimerase [Candidatus Competibacteraceae bacterium]MCP5134668.1 diaminopimelate epimerase [Gammaproteobacteria bacterium]HRY19365.1 diaminopimelate epimerase [Candidatus Competibacteraceae bacterium]
MILKFTKMQGLGNDFVVIDSINQTVALAPEHIRHLADRRFGIGCDQILLVEASQRADVDFRYRIFNADGSEVEQCGNGARCFARFVRDRGLTPKNELCVETLAGLLQLRLLPDGQVMVDMGPPRLEPANVPFFATERALRYAITVDGMELEIGVVSMGNPHAVVIVNDVDQAPVAHLGPLIEQHSRFPKRANVGFMQVVDPNHIRLRVFERGAGETLACGSGACAAAVVGQLWNRLCPNVRVELPGGELEIHWTGEGESVTMTGPAATVFEGWIVL